MPMAKWSAWHDKGARSVSQMAAEPGLPDRLVRSWLRWAEDHAAEASGRHRSGGATLTDSTHDGTSCTALA
jgi:hypothetical protein